MNLSKVKSFITLIVLFLLCQGIYAQKWEVIGFNLPAGDSVSFTCDITFANKNIGWLYSQLSGITSSKVIKKLYRTTNGGQSWQTVRSEINYIDYQTVIFSMEPDFFYMITQPFHSSDPSRAYYTSNGGLTWDSTVIYNGSSVYGFSTLHFFDDKNGIAFDEYNSWITNDGGKTWNRKGEISYPYDVYFLNDKLGWAVGDHIMATDASYIAKTTDGGNTWKYLDRIFSPLFSISFIDSLKGFAVGGPLGGAYYSTINGGDEWLSNVDLGGYDVGFLDNEKGWITQGGQIIGTSDGGETWKNQLDNRINFSLKKLIILKKDKVAFVLGSNMDDMTATLLRADLGNTTDVKNAKEIIPDEFSLTQNYPNPFNPSTNITYSIPQSPLLRGVRGVFVSLKVYDILGREITTLVNEEKKPGIYTVVFNVSKYNLTSGIYIYRLTANSLETGEQFVKSAKMLMIK